jgi:hypothetical protein
VRLSLRAESAADVLKGTAYAAYKINLGHVSFNLTSLAILAAAASVGTAGIGLFLNVRATCLIGGAVDDLLAY